VFPNPTNGILTIEFNSRAGNEQHRVELYNAKGELSASEWVSGERIHLFSLLARPAGVYFFRVVTDTQVETLKIIRL
jgi:hemolysin-activating ACP:hemolysin acyltransferase